MNNEVDKIIQSGQLELYAIGALTPEENRAVETLLATSPEMRTELESIQSSLETIAASFATTPPVTAKPFIFAEIDYLERAAQGKVSAIAPPELNENSTREDYSLWLNSPDNALPADFNEFHAIIIGKDPSILSAIAWLGVGAPLEYHDTQIEKFLILEGTCELVIEEEVHYLKAGDYLAIPLHKKHYLKVTSKNPCKIILQRVAA
jgi:mannose-6-phosphate isomerase-like protein (cupin superfamily)